MEKIPIGTTINTAIEGDMLVFDFTPPKSEKWHPELNEVVFISCVENRFGFMEIVYKDDFKSHNAYELGLIFKTKDEAIEKSKQIVEFLKTPQQYNQIIGRRMTNV
jgi:hypothetical protein